MIVDVHCHLSPPAWARGPMPGALTDIDGFFEGKRRDGITLAVVGNAMVNLPGTGVDNLGLDRIREWNEFAASLVAQHPGEVVAFIGVNPFGGQAMLDELRSAMASGSFGGITVNSSVDGEYLASPRAAEFWALAAELGRPVFVHPPSTPPGASGLGDPRVVEYAARASDVGISVAAVVMAGVLERHPALRLVCAAGAGGLAMLAGRLEVAAEFGSPAGPPGPPPAQLANPPSSYLRQVYVDTCSYSLPALACNVEVFGADRVLFGTDSPPLAVPAARGLELVRALPIDAADRERILWRNAAELLELDAA